MEKKFSSISEEVKVLVNDYMITVVGECDRKDIVAYVKEHINDKNVLSDGIMAGAIKMLTASGELVVISRAKYKKGVKMESLCLRDKVIALFETFQRDLNKVCTVNLLEVSKEDMVFIHKVNELSNFIESKVWSLEEQEEVIPEVKEQVKEEVNAKEVPKKPEVKIESK